jgi:3-oxoacyl-[acyl-carrier protein] reductase
MNILITGASAGIGFHLALLLASNPDNQIFAVARSEQKLYELASKCTFRNLVALPFSVEESISNPLALLDLLEPYTNKIDILINNAGVLINKLFAEISMAEAQKIFNTNYFAVAATIQAVIPMMGKKFRGHIVNISSMGGFQGSAKFPGLAHYSASKAATASLTECLAEEYKTANFSVNALSLGSVQTEMLANAFPGYQAPVNAEEMASFIAWFATHGQHFFNGKILPVSVSVP